MNVEEIQRAFLAHLMGGDDAITPAVKARERRGLAVYPHAYRANLLACLKDTFDKTLAWLGEAEFEAAALAYIADQPPRSWTLNDYGDAFPRLLARLYPADLEVEELAWLDWALRRAFDGEDCEVQSPPTFEDLDWERAVLSIAPTLVMRDVKTNVAALWSAMAEGRSPPPAAALDPPRALAVWRRDLSPVFRTLEARERAALSLARAGAAFGEICAGLALDRSAEEAAAEAGALLAAWLADQIVVGVAPGAASTPLPAAFVDESAAAVATDTGPVS